MECTASIIQCLAEVYIQTEAENVVGYCLVLKIKVTVLLASLSTPTPPLFLNPFSISCIPQSLGIIMTAVADLDRETQDRYELVVKATDMAGQMGGLSGSTTVTIVITDVNDNPPRFPQSECLLHIPLLKQRQRGWDTQEDRREVMEKKETVMTESVKDRSEI